jgi:hypothetical protein
MAKQPRSPFAASMGLYSGNIRSRISQAYQEANIQLQQMMATEQQRRETLLAMYKADMKAIGVLKKRIPAAQKKIKSLNYRKQSDRNKILGLLIQAGGQTVNLNQRQQKLVDDNEQEVLAKYSAPDKVIKAIDTYVDELTFLPGKLESASKGTWTQSLENSFGGANGSPKSKQRFNKLDAAFAGMKENPQKQRSLYLLVQGIKTKLEEDGVNQFGTGVAADTKVDNAINRHLMKIGLTAGGQHRKGAKQGLGYIIDDAEKDKWFNRAWEKKKKELRKTMSGATDILFARTELRRSLKKQKGEDPEVQEKLQEIANTKEEIAALEPNIQTLRAQLQAPMPELPGVRQLAGQILRRENQPFEEIAIERLKKPDSKEQLIADAKQMPDDFIEFMRLSNKGRKTMGVDLQKPKTKAERFYSTLKQNQNFPKTWPEQYKLIQENKELSGMLQKGLREDIKAIAVGQILKAYEDSKAIKQIPVKAAKEASE